MQSVTSALVNNVAGEMSSPVIMQNTLGVFEKAQSKCTYSLINSLFLQEKLDKLEKEANKGKIHSDVEETIIDGSRRLSYYVKLIMILTRALPKGV